MQWISMNLGSVGIVQARHAVPSAGPSTGGFESGATARHALCISSYLL
jgi:hypothetical protein